MPLTVTIERMQEQSADGLGAFCLRIGYTTWYLTLQELAYLLQAEPDAFWPLLTLEIGATRQLTLAATLLPQAPEVPYEDHT